MPRKVILLPEWILQACELMVKYDLSLRQAAAELGQDISIEEAEALKDRKLFKERLDEKRLAHYSEIGSNPKLSKEAVVGMVFKMAERLAADREDYKSADALIKFAKMQGWVGAEPDSLWKVFQPWSQADIDEIKQRLKEQQQAQQPQLKVEPDVEQVN
ncbi:MAG TPA: hypothetical protein VOA64_01910 [Candidatus Dormibacteraeota bacterium]|nr:hypothetical protein [Candidatus Dormibacteraeota bacterium]